MIVSAEFDDRRWELLACNPDGRSCRELRVDPRREVEVRGQGVRAKLHVDPASGEIQRCRGRGSPAR